MNVRFGLADIPLSSENKTILNGLESINRLDLDAIEIQLIRNIGESYYEADKIKKIAQSFNIDLYVHAPYYTNLAGDPEEVEKSMDNLKWAGKVAQELGAATVCINLGMYGENTKQDALEKIVENVRNLRDWLDSNEIEVKIGLEPSGNQNVFGSIDEILEICKQVPGTVPILNFANIHAREKGSLKTKEDYNEIFEKTIKATNSTMFYTRFSGVDHENGNKLIIRPIEKSELQFEHLSKCILEHDDYNVTIISSSPLLEHDALHMKEVFNELSTNILKK
jgi:deoxyribonuclease-4